MLEVGTKPINMVRGQAKSLGLRAPKCSSDVIYRRAAKVLSEEDVLGMTIVLETIVHLTALIRELDQLPANPSRPRRKDEVKTPPPIRDAART